MKKIITSLAIAAIAVGVAIAKKPATPEPPVTPEPPAAQSSKTPLYVVDGQIIDQADAAQMDNLKRITPNDYSSVTVLKGAAATSIYGDQAANGAIVLQTLKADTLAGGIVVRTVNTHQVVNVIGDTIVQRFHGTYRPDPIYIVDGVVVDRVALGGAVKGNRHGLQGLDMEGYSSVTVLKGAAATSIYGDQATGGAIVLTTKQHGKTRKGYAVDITPVPAGDTTQYNVTITSLGGSLPAGTRRIGYAVSPAPAGYVLGDFGCDAMPLSDLYMVGSDLMHRSDVMAQAQQPNTGGGRPQGEGIHSMKIAYITNALSLTPEESQKFWPLYNQYWAERRAVGRERVELYRQVKAGTATDAQLTAFADIYKKEWQITQTYTEKFRTVLPADKVAKFFVAEEDFKNYLLRQAAGSRGQGEGGGAR